MGEFRVHHARFFEYSPSAIQCLAYEEKHKKLALSRADGSIEIWCTGDVWYQERLLPPQDGCTVEALVWSGRRLFSAGLHGELHEHDIVSHQVKASVPSNNGAIWCLAINEAGTAIAAGTENGCVVMFDISDDSLQYEMAFDKQEGRILSLAWHEAENVIVTGGIDNLRVWSASSGHARQRLTLGRQEKNKETIVWAVAVTKDFTIVSGDSRGKTCFWNGKMGTLKKAIASHQADVLSVCVAADGNTVFSSGIDPNLVQFDLVPVNADSNWNMWVRTAVRSQHTHDVRALAVAGDYVVSAGVDCHLIYNFIESGNASKNWRRIPPVPQSPLVSFAREAEFVLLRYHDYLELWKLGATSKTSEKNGETLPLSKNPVKLLQVKSRGGQPITGSAISADGQWMAYADRTNISVFNIELDEDIIPGIKLTKVKAVPAGLLPSLQLAFSSPSSRVGGQCLVSATSAGSIQLMDVEEGGVTLRMEIPPCAGKPGDTAESIHLLSVSSTGKYMAAADLNNNVNIYSLSKGELVCSLPRASSQPVSLAFHPLQPLLAVAYADQTMYEFDIKQKEYTDWSRGLNRFLPPRWSKRHSPITQMFYHPTHTHLLFVKDELMFCIIDKTKELQHHPEKDKKVFHMCSKFKYLLYLDAVKDDFLLAVERPPLAITETLPPTIKKSKFGT